MRKLLLSAVALAGLSQSAEAGTWWILNSRDGACMPAINAARTTRDIAMASPFALAAEMRSQGRLNAPIDQKRIGGGSGYVVFYDGVSTAFFTSRPACGSFLGWMQARGDLPR
jgi:hypothetical protein